MEHKQCPKRLSYVEKGTRGIRGKEQEGEREDHTGVLVYDYMFITIIHYTQGVGEWERGREGGK